MVTETSFIFSILAFIIGAVVGSFTYTAVLRRKKGKSLLSSSKCDSCNTKIPYIYSLPILGIILSKFKCTKCNCPIEKGSLFVEVLMGISFVILLFASKFEYSNMNFYLGLLFFVSLIYNSIFDFLYMEIDMLVALISVALASILYLPLDLTMGLLGMMTLTLYFGVIIYFFKDKMGFGDIILGTLCGTIGGLVDGLWIINFSVIFALVYGFIVWLFFYKSKELSILKLRVPMFPFFAFAIILYTTFNLQLNLLDYVYL